jgi:hypothetical protein
MFISKLKKKPLIPVIFCTCDIETTVINGQHVPVAYSIFSEELNIKKSRSIIYYNSQNIVLDSENLMENFLEVLFETSEKVKTTLNYKLHTLYFLFHNFAKFDSIFILNYAIKKKFVIDIYRVENILYRLSLTNTKNITINFKDTFLIFPLPLAK